jgi:hypothetical protein
MYGRWWWVVAGAAACESGRRLFRVTVVAAAILAAGAPPAGALGSHPFPSVEETAIGLGGILSDLWPLGGERGASVILTIADVRLYDVSGFHAPGLRAGGRVGPYSLTCDVSQVVSGVGTETRICLAPAVFAGDRWAASVALAHERVSIEGFLPESETAVDIASTIRLTDSVRIGGEARHLRVVGESGRGADVVTAVIVNPAGAARLRAVLEIDRRTGVYPLVSATLCGGSGFRITAGYRGATGAVAGAAGFGVAGLVCAAGAEIHPVLGYRSGVTLTWRR